MSQIRTQHPGYYGVVIGASVPWYLGLGVVFTFFGAGLRHSPDYSLVLAYLPIHLWGYVYFLIGGCLAAVASIPRVPHKYVRIFATLGLLCTFFWLCAFVITALIAHLVTPTLIPAWATLMVMEYQIIIEPEINPARSRSRVERYITDHEK